MSRYIQLTPSRFASLILLTGLLVGLAVFLRITASYTEEAQDKRRVHLELQSTEPAPADNTTTEPQPTEPALVIQPVTDPVDYGQAEYGFADHGKDLAELLAIEALDPEQPTLEPTVAKEKEAPSPNPADFGVLVDNDEPTEAETEDDPILRGGASVQGTLPNGEPVTIADFDSKRLAKMKPRHRRHSKFNQKGKVAEDGERLRFDGDKDFFSIYDNLELGDHKNIDLSFELEFDTSSDSERSDLTVFWGAEDREQRSGRGNISSAWTGYELKLGGPGINHVAYKHGGHDLVPRGNTPETFEPGKKYQIDIEQRDGDITLKIDGKPVFERSAIPSTGERSGFGLLFYQASGWVGPVKISASN